MHNFVPMKAKFDEVAAFLCHGNHKMFLKDVKKRLKDLNHTLGRGGPVGERRDEVEGGEGGGWREGGGGRMERGRRGKDGEREEGKGWREGGGGRMKRGRRGKDGELT